ncbi:hypothetical protein NESM_000155100 [Novymonas esmeraldas]|uniref:Uncharacterized protein n=1 Tax=Novymonas esmeraldas TaxID=1808958 RepID=A0AAW0F736_9TRYP
MSSARPVLLASVKAPVEPSRSSSAAAFDEALLAGLMHPAAFAFGGGAQEQHDTPGVPPMESDAAHRAPVPRIALDAGSSRGSYGTTTSPAVAPTSHTSRADTRQEGPATPHLGGIHSPPEAAPATSATAEPLSPRSRAELDFEEALYNSLTPGGHGVEDSCGHERVTHHSAGDVDGTAHEKVNAASAAADVVGGGHAGTRTRATPSAAASAAAPGHDDRAGSAPRPSAATAGEVAFERVLNGDVTATAVPTATPDPRSGLDDTSTELAEVDGGGAPLADAEAATEVVAPVPPTVSMRCVFDLSRRDAPPDREGLDDAVFHVVRSHTDVVTHVDAAERVARCMPLLDRVSKDELFVSSGWVRHLERAAAPPREDSSPAGVEGSAPVQLPDTHREVVGRSKVVRCLLFRLLRAPHLWWDQVQEVVLLAAERAAAQLACSTTTTAGAATVAGDRDVVERLTGTPRGGGDEVERSPRLQPLPALVERTTPEAVLAAMSRVFAAAAAPSGAHLFSDALRCALVDMDDADSSLSAFDGPIAAWRAFVLTQRHSSTAVCGPHVPPFSFGEDQPTIAATDLAPLEYCEAAASWGDTSAASAAAAAAVAASPPLMSETSTVAAAATPAAWEALSEQEQNAFLFGTESAALSQRLGDCSGVFAVFTENHTPSASESLCAEAAEADAAEATNDGEDGDGDTSQSSVAAPSPLQRELARVHAYDVDRLVLELVNGEGAPWATAPAGRSPFVSQMAATPTACPPPYRPPLQNGEDVQMAALWQRFVRAPTGDLLCNLLHVRRHARSLLDEALLDVAVQRAFWLLFFARDEVRAVTHPRRTHATVWRLHHQLVSLFAEAHRAAAAAPSATLETGEGPSAHRLCGTFDELSLHSQVSYACFGCSHVPQHPCTRDHGEAASAVPCVTPADLFASLRATYDGTSRQVAEPVEYAALSELQRLAVGFCFPRTDRERAVVARVAEARTARARRAAATSESAATLSAIAGPSPPPPPPPPLPPPAHDAGHGDGYPDGGAAADVGDALERRLRVQRALESSMFECLRALRAAGALEAAHFFSARADAAVTLATFSAAQRRTVQRAALEVATTLLGAAAAAAPSTEPPAPVVPVERRRRGRKPKSTLASASHDTNGNGAVPPPSAAAAVPRRATAASATDAPRLPLRSRLLQKSVGPVRRVGRPRRTSSTECAESDVGR